MAAQSSFIHCMRDIYMIIGVRLLSEFFCITYSTFYNIPIYKGDTIHYILGEDPSTQALLRHREELTFRSTLCVDYRVDKLFDL